MPTQRKKVLTISDLHVGDNTALMPPEVEVEGGGRYSYNPIQKEIWKHWEKMLDDVGKVDVLVVNGECCEGYHSKSYGKGCWTTDISLQIATVTELLKMIKVRDTRIITQGSLYHSYENMSSDEAVAKSLGAEFDDDMKLTFKEYKKSFHFMHKVGVSSSVWMYRSTPLAREMLLAELEKDVYGNIDVIVRGHAHYYWENNSGSHIGVILPCWKGRDVYVKRKSLAYTPTPHLGYVLFEVSKDGINVDANIFKLKGKNIMKEVVIWPKSRPKSKRRR